MSMSSAAGTFRHGGIVLILTIRPECKIQSCDKIHIVEFMPDCKHLVSGGQEVQVWRLEDSQQVATLLKASDVVSLAVSNDGRWIAAGTRWSGVQVWNAETHECFRLGDDSDGHFHLVNSVDFSPKDSTQLVIASEDTATVWDIAIQKRIKTLKHSYFSVMVVAAKYSPQGDRIATVTLQNLRIWDSERAKSLVSVSVQCGQGDLRRGLSWVNNHLFIISSDMVVKLDTSTGSTVSKWTIPLSPSCYSAIALPQHELFFAYSIENTLTIWEASIPTALGVIYHHENIRSISLSPDGQFVAVVGESGTIALQSLSALLEMALLGDLSTPVSLMREWVKSMLTRSSWKDILAALVNASISFKLDFVCHG
ncbi:WD40-repeat-containing domain protein [Chiua virens]|nr:WD40-repeat-containing domain protein [Chiua virens]